ncbi:N-acetylmuramoyl-L-alanine amidase [Taklimakanibacter lacteus]|uniref:N-acetylmuramoyl-L-alanine amidase n=1 Tax=Taklimakanibacter lacteus TaxID=2268456 RepID=UPI0034D3C15F
MILTLAAMVAAAGAHAEPVTALAARVAGDDSKTRFVADLSRPVSYSVYVLPDPYRVMIDLPDVSFDLASDAGEQGLGLVSAYRFGPLGKGRSRIVIEATGPVLIGKSFLVRPEDGQPARLVVDLVKTDEKTFLMAHAADQATRPAPLNPAAQADDASGGDNVETATSAPLPLPKPGTEPAAIERPMPAKRADGRRVIVIDPGHGGIDPGAVGVRRTKEKDVVLAFSRALRDRLKGNKNYEVVLTRDTDTFLSLKQRVAVARENQADLFIAVHADTVRGRSVRGATLYTLSEKASDAEAEALAQKENRADIIGGMDLATENQEVTDILIELAQRETKNHSMFFARKAATQLQLVTHMTGKPTRSAGFVVLKAPDVPSVLLELGYLSNRSDEALLVSPKWQSDVTQAMAKAIDAYFATELAARQ